jgi:hypothetical protein
MARSGWIGVAGNLGAPSCMHTDETEDHRTGAGEENDMQPVPQDRGHAASVLCSVSLSHIYAFGPNMSHSCFSFRLRHEEPINREKRRCLQ